MTHRLERLLRPRSVAVIGGGAWCANVVRSLRGMGFDGDIRVVHPSKAEIGGVAAVRRIEELPAAPDAAFIGVNRVAAVEAVAVLSARGAGGAVCFASGFREAAAELGDGADLQARLVAAAGGMPVLGPNCYGFVNALEGVALWPDEQGAARVARGVAIVTQSSNLAINLTMQRRALPIAAIVTAGNQALVDQSEIARALLEDDRVTALGLHVEGVGDLRGMEALGGLARRLGKRVVALKVGESEQARAATVSHTASLAGGAAGARALFGRLGFAQVHSAPALLDALHILHRAGPLPSRAIAGASCSGGEASLLADAAQRHGLALPALTKAQRETLGATLGPRVALANPLDYHTYIWGDLAAMAAVFGALQQGEAALTCLVADFPHEGRCDPAAWRCIIDAAIAAAGRGKLALIASMPENLPEAVARDLADHGVIPLFGLDDGLAAIAAAATQPAPEAEPLWLPQPPSRPTLLSEAESKAALGAHGLATPQSRRATSEAELRAATAEIGAPLVIKAEGLAHKSDSGGVTFARDDPEPAIRAALAMPCESWLVEEMIGDAVVELLVGVVCDPAHGYVLTLGAGGVRTEILKDTVSLLLPARDADILAALARLRIAPLLDGYRGRPGVDKAALLKAVAAVQSYVAASRGAVAEVEINPLLCGPERAVAVDALIRREDRA